MKLKLLLLGLGFVLILGRSLDNEAERMIDQFYYRHENGVILGAEPIKPEKISHKQAILLLHGFLETPKVFKTVITHLNHEDKADIYAPLLPYHGRNLQTAAKLNNNTVQAFIAKEIESLSKKYEFVTVVAHSYSGAQVSNLLQQHKIPQNVYPILYAPAIYIYLNTPVNSFRNHIYKLWRNYCNYELLGCNKTTKIPQEPELINEISLNYKIVSAVLELFKLDQKSRGILENINRNFSLIIAKDDNRVSFKEIKKACRQNAKHCKLFIFDDGKHMLHYTHHKQAFENIILKELSQFSYAEGP